MKINRLAIMVIYDTEGIVAKYVEKILDEIKKNVNKLIIVSNGSIEQESYKKLQNYTHNIFIRENKGFDAGAYQEMINYLISCGEWQLYNQVLLLNDSFFGFFYPLQQYLEQAAMTQNVDFWGITRSPEYITVSGIKINSHLQSYFLLINERMMQSLEFQDFWKNLKYAETLSDAVKNFELKFTPYFEERGFRSKAFCEPEDGSLTFPDYVKNPYQDYIYELVTQWRCPILKIKSLRITESGPYKVLDFIEKNGLYDSSLIWNYLKSEGAINRFGKSTFGAQKIIDFCQSFSCIYIYGNGGWARKIRSYLEYKNIGIQGNIVTKIEKNFHVDGIIEFKDLDISENTGIILALNKKNTFEVLPLVRKRVPERQIFIGDF